MEDLKLEKFKEQMNSICHFVFKEQITLQKHLTYMNNNPEEQYLNILSIFNSKSMATKVMLVEDWNRELNIENAWIKKGETGIPIITEWSEIDEINLDYIDHEKVAKAFDYSQLSLSSNKEFGLVSPLRKFIIEVGSRIDLCLDKNEPYYWTAFVESCCEKNKYYRKNPDYVQSFILNCCLYATSTVFDSSHSIDVKSVNFVKNDELIKLYKCLKDIISDIPDRLISLYQKALEAEKKRVYLLKVEERKKRTLRKRIEDAKKKVKKKEETNYDY